MRNHQITKISEQELREYVRHGCRKRGYRYEVKGDKLMVQTKLEKWYLIYEEDQVDLYHGNSKRGRKRDYHLQMKGIDVREFFTYIEKHEIYRYHRRERVVDLNKEWKIT